MHIMTAIKPTQFFSAHLRGGTKKCKDTDSVGGHARGNHTLMFPSLSPSLPLSLKINKIFKKITCLKKKVSAVPEDGGEIGGSGVHFPSAPVKHLADLRNRVNSQRYSSIYEDQRPKIEDIERSDGKKSA